jgi:hypothetical protein
MTTRKRRYKVTGKATVECGVCGREKVPPDTPGAVKCGRDRDTSEGKVACSAYVIEEAPSG